MEPLRRQRPDAHEPPGRGARDRHRGRDGFTVDGRRYELEAGDSIHFRTLLPHSWSNPREQPAARDLARRPLVLTRLWLEGVRDLLDAVLDGVADAIYLVGPRGEVRLINPAGLAVLGYDCAEELLGRDSHATIHHSRADGTPFPAEECPLLQARTSGRTVRVEQDWFVRRDGSMVPVAYASAPFQTDDGPRRRRRLPRHLRAAGVRGRARPRGRRAGARGGARALARAARRAPPRPSGAGSGATSTTARSSGWCRR